MYNKSEIFKKAWEIKKTLGYDFSVALKCAWFEAKKAVKEAAKAIVKKAIVITNIEKWFLKKMDTVSFMALESGIGVNDIILEKETEKAIQISTEWDGYRKYMWIPKSVVEFN